MFYRKQLQFLSSNELIDYQTQEEVTAVRYRMVWPGYTIPVQYIITAQVQRKRKSEHEKRRETGRDRNPEIDI